MASYDRTRPIAAQLCDVLGLDAGRVSALSISVERGGLLFVKATMWAGRERTQEVVQLLRAANLEPVPVLVAEGADAATR